MKGPTLREMQAMTEERLLIVQERIRVYGRRRGWFGRLLHYWWSSSETLCRRNMERRYMDQWGVINSGLCVKCEDRWVRLVQLIRDRREGEDGQGEDGGAYGH